MLEHSKADDAGAFDSADFPRSLLQAQLDLTFCLHQAS